LQTNPEIIYIDSNLLALNKPALIHSVSLKENSIETIANWLIKNYPGIELSSDNPHDAGLINRLDFETSGILIAARTKSDWLALREQYKNLQIRKTYHALVHGKVSTPIVIEGYIGNRYRGSKKVSFSLMPEKRFQYTKSVIRRVINFDQNKCASMIEVETSTGARHQVRAHCASVGHVLVGDRLYGSEVHAIFKLHAAKVELIHPRTGEKICIKAPVYNFHDLDQL
jgi:23S rRNA pseudouridine1911/1915/1917 synthase